MPSSAPLIEDALGHALTYAKAGLRVLPIKPGAKYPPMNSWQNAASVDPKVITNWYQGLYQGHGVGIAMGPQPNGRWLFALDVDEHDPNASGSDTLHELEATHGKLPDTVRSITGAGGAHIILAAPPGIEIRNGVAGAGIDIRGDGGQIVVAPTIHPSGIAYTWEHGFAPWEIDIAEAPAWLLQLLATPEPAPPPSVTQQLPSSNRESPADRLRDTWNWHTELAARGWQLHHTDRQSGDTHWTSPHKDLREGSSAVLHEPDGPLNIFTTHPSAQDMWRNGTTGRNNTCVAVTPFVFYAAYNHNGDLTAASHALLGDRGELATIGILNPSATPTQALRELLINWPEFWATDHSAEEWIAWPLIPAHRQVALFAPAKTGKSIITLAACAAVATGRPILGGRPQPRRHVLYLDYEMTAGDLHERLEALSYSAEDNLDHLHYALLPSLPPLNTDAGCRALCELAAEVAAEVVVIDTMGRAIAGEENSSDSYQEFARTTGLLLKAAGRAVLRTDHAGKDKERGQRGSSAKNDDVDVVIRIDTVEGGWTLTRTHSRVNWVPDKVVITRTDMADGTVRLNVDERKRTYVTGTKELVDVMRALGIDHTWTKPATATALRDAGHKVSSKRIVDARAWMNAELPVFTTEPVENLVDSVRTGARTDRTFDDEDLFADRTDPPQNPSTTDADRPTDRCGPVDTPNGDQDLSLREVRSPRSLQPLPGEDLI